MEWIEADPLPKACMDCQEEDCYNCDTAGERWQLSRNDELKLRRKQLVKAINRLQHKVDILFKTERAIYFGSAERRSE